MKVRDPLSILLATIIGVSIIGFLRGTDRFDYDLQTPLTAAPTNQVEGVPRARTYAELRDATTADGSKVARSCQDCHPERVTNASRGHRTEHPVGVPAPKGARLDGLLAAGGRLASDDRGRRTIVCRTCHRPHNASVDARLVVTADDGTLCLSCHQDHSPSHSRHPVSVRVPPSMRAAIEAAGGEAGDRMSCLGCHAPHDSTAGTLLRTDDAGAGACRLCHQDQAHALGASGHGGLSCTECHGMHRAPAHEGWGPEAGKPADQACVDCHAGGRGEAPQVPLDGGGHPIWARMPSYMNPATPASRVGCTDCHDPHGRDRRLMAGGTLAGTCTGCHRGRESVTGTDHDAAVVPVAGSDGTCISCHPVHGSGELPPPPEGVNPASGRCLSCHDGRTSATEVREWRHPGNLLLTTSGLPFNYSGPVPYFGPDGRPTTKRAAGEIACPTCHEPHRWRHDADQHPGAADGTEQNSFLRDPAEVVRLCAACHGTEARPRHRFFHEARYRDQDGG